MKVTISKYFDSVNRDTHKVERAVSQCNVGHAMIFFEESPCPCCRLGHWLNVIVKERDEAIKDAQSWKSIALSLRRDLQELESEQ